MHTFYSVVVLTLACYHNFELQIQKECTIEMCYTPRRNNLMQIYVSKNGANKSLTVRPFDTVQSVKEKLDKRRGVELYFGWKRLEDSKTLFDCDVSLVHLQFGQNNMSDLPHISCPFSDPGRDSTSLDLLPAAKSDSNLRQIN